LGVDMAIGITEILIILIIILIVFGPKRLPQLARSIGDAVREYRKGMAGQKPKKPKG